MAGFSVVWPHAGELAQFAEEIIRLKEALALTRKEKEAAVVQVGLGEGEEG